MKNGTRSTSGSQRVRKQLRSPLEHRSSVSLAVVSCRLLQTPLQSLLCMLVPGERDLWSPVRRTSSSGQKPRHPRGVFVFFFMPRLYGRHSHSPSSRRDAAIAVTSPTKQPTQACSKPPHSRELPHTRTRITRTPITRAQERACVCSYMHMQYLCREFIAADMRSNVLPNFLCLSSLGNDGNSSFQPARACSCVFRLLQ